MPNKSVFTVYHSTVAFFCTQQTQGIKINCSHLTIGYRDWPITRRNNTACSHQLSFITFLWHCTSLLAQAYISYTSTYLFCSKNVNICRHIVIVKVAHIYSCVDIIAIRISISYVAKEFLVFNNQLWLLTTTPVSENVHVSMWFVLNSQTQCASTTFTM